MRPSGSDLIVPYWLSGEPTYSLPTCRPDATSQRETSPASAMARYVPSGVYTMESAAAEMGGAASAHVDVLTSRTTPVARARARVPPSGENAMLVTGMSLPTSGEPTSSPVATSHTDVSILGRRGGDEASVGAEHDPVLPSGAPAELV